MNYGGVTISTTVIKNLNVYRENGSLVIKNLSFKIRENEKIALIGQEGNGKTTILNAIYNNCNVEGFSISGQVFASKNIAYIKQSIDEWSMFTVVEYLVCESIENAYDFDYNKLSVYIRNLERFKLDRRIIDNNPRIDMLSGGEKLKLQFLKTLSEEFDLLLLDEPTNDLDLEGVEFIEDYILNCEKKVVFVSHDRTLIDNCATHILHIEMLNRQTKQVNTFFHGNYSEYIKDKYEKHDKSVHQRQNESRAYRKKQIRLNDIKNKVVSKQNNISRSKPYEAKRLKKMVKSTKRMIENNESTIKTNVDTFESNINIEFKSSDVNNKVLYELNGYDHTVGDSKLLIKDVNITLYGKSKYVIVGNNGCGKSTLVKKIVKDLNSTGVNYFYMPQDYSEVLDFEKTPISFLQEFCGTVVGLEDITNVLTSLNLEYEETVTRIKDLSEGQKSKVIIAILCLKKFDILVIDEITRNLSPLTLDEITLMLKEYNGCILAISHDRYFIDQIFDTVIDIKKGKATYRRM